MLNNFILIIQNLNTEKHLSYEQISTRCGFNINSTRTWMREMLQYRSVKDKIDIKRSGRGRGKKVYFKLKGDKKSIIRKLKKEYYLIEKFKEISQLLDDDSFSVSIVLNMR